MATLPSLVRAAELVVSGEFDRGLVHDTEQLLLNNADPSRLAEELERKGWDHVQIDRYLTEREQPPSAAALQRFVAYAAARDMWGRGILRVVDITDLDTGAIRAFADEVGSPHIYIAGSDVAPRALYPSSCDRVLDDLAEPASHDDASSRRP